MSNRKNRRAWPLLLAVLALTWAGTSDAFAEGRIGSIRAVQGTGLIQRTGEPDFVPVKRGDPVNVQDVLVTDPKESKVWMRTDAPNEGDVSLGRSTAFVGIGYSVQGAGVAFAGQVPQGVVRFIKRLPLSSPPSSYTVFTPTALVQVMPVGRAADFVVEALNERTSQITCIWGEIRVDNVDQQFSDERLLRSCQTVIVEKDQLPSPVMGASRDMMRELVRRTTIPNTLPTEVPSCQAPPPLPESPLPLDYDVSTDVEGFFFPGFVPWPYPVPIPPFIPTMPTYPTVPTTPTMPTTPTVPTTPTMPTVPTTPTTPTVPTTPTTPTVPTSPTTPTLPTLVTLRTFPTLMTFPTLPTVRTLPSVFTLPTFFTVPTRFTFPSLMTLRTFPTLRTFFTLPTSVTVPTIPTVRTFPTFITLATFPSIATLRTFPTLATLRTFPTLPPVVTVATRPATIFVPEGGKVSDKVRTIPLPSILPPRTLMTLPQVVPTARKLPSVVPDGPKTFVPGAGQTKTLIERIPQQPKKLEQQIQQPDRRIQQQDQDVLQRQLKEEHRGSPRGLR